MSWKDINLERNLNRSPHPKKTFPIYQQHHITHVQTIEKNAKFLTPKKTAQVDVAKQLLHALGYLLWSTSRPSLKQM